MRKITLGAHAPLYPKPALLIGANFNGKPNFMTVACFSGGPSKPPMVSITIQRQCYTYEGIKQNGTFSVNVPSAHLVRETDYCGIVSGAEHDKVSICGFTVFYGKLNTAPLIDQFPINLECTVAHTIELGTHVFLIGEVKETHVLEDCVTAGQPDPYRLNPIVYIAGNTKAYHSLGELLAQAYSVGRELTHTK